MTQSISKPVAFKEGDGTLHGFSTGLVKVKSKFRTAKGGELTSKFHVLMDSQFTEYMPIMVWVIDHPEGVFVIDTGENAKVSDHGYFEDEGMILNYINSKSFIFDVKPEQEIGPQLKSLGFKNSSIKSVILTHLHLDHVDGLKYFESTDIIINQYEWDNPGFALPSLYPEWFSPKTVDLQNKRENHFKLTYPLVSTDEIQIVHTPGHTLGHCSVLVKTSDIHYLLAGDVTYNQDQLMQYINAGGHQSFKHSQRTYKSIKRYAFQNRLIYLPSHDNSVFDRLSNNEIFNPEQ